MSATPCSCSKIMAGDHSRLASPFPVTVVLWGGYAWHSIDDGPPGCEPGRLIFTTTTWNGLCWCYQNEPAYSYFHISNCASGKLIYTFDSCGPTTVCLTSPLDLAPRQGSHHCVATSPHRDGCLATPTAAPLELPEPRPWVCEHRPFPAPKKHLGFGGLWQLLFSWSYDSKTTNCFSKSRWLMMIVYC